MEEKNEPAKGSLQFSCTRLRCSQLLESTAGDPRGISRLEPEPQNWLSGLQPRGAEADCRAPI